MGASDHTRKYSCVLGPCVMYVLCMFCEHALQQISAAPWIKSVSPCYRWLGSQDLELVWSHTQP